MKKKKSSRASLGDVARVAKISKVAASFALKNRPGVSKATRERVLRIARQLGYAPDARAAVLMASVRGAKTKELLPIAWLNTDREKDAWQKYKFYRLTWKEPGNGPSNLVIGLKKYGRNNPA